MPLALSDLLCTEDAGTLSSEDPAEHHNASSPADNILSFPDESIAEFLGGAADYSPGFDYSARFRSRVLDPTAREESADWILKFPAADGVSLAVNYLDRFLAAHQLPEPKGWALQLLAVTCLSLAAKMEETLVPSLLDLQVEGARFIFEPRTICKMELLVLTALKWGLRSVTPFNFTDFFLCVQDIDFLDHCPSSMAAAAMICAVKEIPGIALVDSNSAMAWCIGLTEEGIANCYRLMQVVGMDNKQSKPVVILPQLRLTTMDGMSSDASSSSSSHSPNKKRKLNHHLWVEDDKEGM